ncbi:hypothetical protein NEIFLAOT_01571 [Neisseria flavescens NRL30031/H210]|uniref:Uncharacterized protein n=1 Tax=Neisseria flavescens NRL30031/H210 TaxID=546264 RepID=C0ENN4_NEIFL|nr:hypothetical protein NEIFLAOT_01571 [Neisseria flavescens NRL30031/H210]
MKIPCVAIMAIQAAHQATLQKKHVAQTRTIDSTARFNRMNNAFAVVVAVAKVFQFRLWGNGKSRGHSVRLKNVFAYMDCTIIKAV